MVAYNRSLFVFMLLLVLLASCNGSGMFGSKNPHTRYEERLRKSGLAEDAMGKAWLLAAEQSIAYPLTITLPFKEAGYFSSSEARAVCYRFNARRGQKITITLNKRPATGAALFAELLRPADDHTEPRLVATPDSSGAMSYEMGDDEDIFLRLQPELLVSVSYELTIVAGPSLAFPVSGGTARDVGSVWGVDRDAGARKHEGIDIFDRRRTPLVAVADGEVHRVQETKRGGKVLWLRPDDKNLHIYYAHLDEQLAHNGQRVKVGDTLGLMGNTGNAKTTPVHLHFGIYTTGGAVDPLPFVKPASEKPPAIAGRKSLLGSGARVNSRRKLAADSMREELVALSYINVRGAMGGQYLVSLPDGRLGFLPVDAVDNLTSVRKTKLPNGVQLLDKPAANAPVIAQLSVAADADVLAVSGQYILVSTGGNKGWVMNGN